MTPTNQRRLEAWYDETRRLRFHHPDWRAVRLLAGLTVALLLAGLVGEAGWGSRQLSYACWVAAALTGTAMLVWLYDDRLFIQYRRKSR